MELTYHWEGDVLIPDLELEDGSNYQIGKYGRMRQRYLFENHHAMYTHLVLTEKLWKHLEEVDMECNDMMIFKQIPLSHSAIFSNLIIASIFQFQIWNQYIAFPMIC